MRDRRREALQLFALCGLAFAEPLLDLFGRNSTFLVAHDIDGFSLVLLGLVLVLVPPLVLTALVNLVRLVSPKAARIVFLGAVGALAALIVVPNLKRGLGLSDAGWIVAVVVVAGGMIAAFVAFQPVRQFVTILAAAPALFLFLFLFASPANALLADSTPSSISGAPSATTPVVFLVFDELALATIVDGNGRIDAARYPNFARLAGQSTWYSNATTVAPSTDRAVPALQTGLIPGVDDAPVASVFPRSVFTMLGKTGETHAIEDVTHLCPDTLCRDRPKAPSANLLSDTLILLGHRVLPEDAASDWLPSIDGKWAGFDEEPTPTSRIKDGEPSDLTQYKQKFHAALDAQGGRSDPIGLFEQYVASMRGPARAGLWYGHFHFPHSEYARLPDGTLYIDRATWPNQRNFRWSSQLASVNAVRYMAQVAAADRLLGQMLDRLEQQKMLDKAMVVVVADHGQTFRSDNDVRARKALTKENRDDVLPVPLFVKYPGESTGKIDTRHAETIDIVPTIADALDIKLPKSWKFDGSSLLAPPTKRARTLLLTPPNPNLLADVQAKRGGKWFRDQMIEQSHDDSDFYRLAPYGALVGRPVTDLDVGAPVPGARVRLDSPDAYQDVQLGTGRLPALISGATAGLTPGTYIAVALNGKIAGLGPVYTDRGNGMEALLDPARFVAGANQVTAYAVSGDPKAPKLAPIRVGE